MVEPTLSRLEVWVWAYFSPDTRNYPGLHFTAKPASCDALLGYLQSIRDTAEVRSRTVPLREPRQSDIALISGDLRFRAFTKLRLVLGPERSDLRQMSIREDHDTATFELTHRSLDQFVQGLHDVRAGTGDYSIQVNTRSGIPVGQMDRGSLALWFWPCFGHTSVDSP